MTAIEGSAPAASELTPEAAAASYDPFDRAVLEDPFPYYDVLRDEHPVHWVPHRQTWMLFRHDDVASAAQHSTIYSSLCLGTYRVFDEPLAPGLLGVDAPDHPRIRRHSRAAFANARIEGLYDDARATAARVLDAVAGREVVDFAAEIAEPYVTDFAGRAIGLPPEARANAARWAEMCSDFLGPDTPRYPELAKVWYEEIPTFFGSNQEWEPDSIFSELMAAGAESDDVEMDEIFAMFGNIVGAGFDTGINAAGHAALVFAEQPDTWDEIRADRTLVPNILEEAVRWDAPGPIFFRRATEDVPLHDRVIRRGHKVGLCFASANRDPRKWGDDADRFDIHRTTTGHLGFGWGPHLCVGAPLARLEARALWDELAERVVAFELAGEPVRRYNTIIRGYSSIPMRLRFA